MFKLSSVVEKIEGRVDTSAYDPSLEIESYSVIDIETSVFYKNLFGKKIMFNNLMVYDWESHASRWFAQECSMSRKRRSYINRQPVGVFDSLEEVMGLDNFSKSDIAIVDTNAVYTYGGDLTIYTLKDGQISKESASQSFNPELYIRDIRERWHMFLGYQIQEHSGLNSEDSGVFEEGMTKKFEVDKLGNMVLTRGMDSLLKSGAAIITHEGLTNVFQLLDSHINKYVILSEVITLKVKKKQSLLQLRNNFYGYFPILPEQLPNL